MNGTSLWEPGYILPNTCPVHEQPVCWDVDQYGLNFWEPGGILSQTCYVHEQPTCRDANIEVANALPVDANVRLHQQMQHAASTHRGCIFNL